ncbi:hypothetical protein JCM17823_02640 [Halorubrum gandharaense]
MLGGWDSKGQPASEASRNVFRWSSPAAPLSPTRRAHRSNRTTPYKALTGAMEVSITLFSTQPAYKRQTATSKAQIAAYTPSTSRVSCFR